MEPVPLLCRDIAHEEYHGTQPHCEYRHGYGAVPNRERNRLFPVFTNDGELENEHARGGLHFLSIVVVRT